MLNSKDELVTISMFHKRMLQLSANVRFLLWNWLLNCQSHSGCVFAIRAIGPSSTTLNRWTLRLYHQQQSVTSRRCETYQNKYNGVAKNLFALNQVGKRIRPLSWNSKNESQLGQYLRNRDFGDSSWWQLVTNRLAISPQHVYQRSQIQNHKTH